MSLSYLIAFGGPVLVGLTACGVVLLLDPRRGTAAPSSDSLAAQLTDLERASRNVADRAAFIRQQLPIR